MHREFLNNYLPAPYATRISDERDLRLQFFLVFHFLSRINTRPPRHGEMNTFSEEAEVGAPRATESLAQGLVSELEEHFVHG